MNPNDTAQATDDQTADQPGDQPQGYCVELHVRADGSMSVSVDPEAAEATEEQGGDQGGVQVKNLRDAMETIMRVVQNNGQLPDEAGAEDSFNSGYSDRTPGNGLAQKFA